MSSKIKILKYFRISVHLINVHILRHLFDAITGSVLTSVCCLVHLLSFYLSCSTRSHRIRYLTPKSVSTHRQGRYLLLDELLTYGPTDLRNQLRLSTSFALQSRYSKTKIMWTNKVSKIRESPSTSPQLTKTLRVINNTTVISAIIYHVIACISGWRMM